MELKKGDLVVMHSCLEADFYEGTIWVCKTDECKLQEEHDYKVVWLEGFRGCFNCKYLQKINLSSYKGVLR